ncbi:SDR family NAD(P)-dependent oxidoreductase [Pseudoalteromonas sp. MMG012]|uniref:SDR family NAD(P)-dependent oxidoreductase n=1 Tax=Pseudoalteromonas sp. MMG012 TaxID=2822686 RepID=UPI001B39FCED|nr:SDR family NAD(P)-dependent oxidoreductase [Pseudoalteromonas sp. MMG012]MBQ4850931.1 SDR family NAD(P)-dependent oxidoreductase [Pseudoalteromonas sp. MMG012]
MQDTHIVIGASAAIAQAFIKLQRHRDPNSSLYSLSQKSLVKQDENHHHITCAYDEQSIEATVQQLSEILKSVKSITIFTGQLHNSEFSPEKKLEDFSLAYFDWLFRANAATPLLWLKYLAPHLSKINHPCIVTCLSARVASITENELGGWYSYRASKAALNMMVKTAAIELKRRAKTTKLVLFHPGTTDTPLSAPFQKNVPKEKLFTPMFVAQQLSHVIDTRVIDGDVDYIDWQGHTISW